MARASASVLTALRRLTYYLTRTPRSQGPQTTVSRDRMQDTRFYYFAFTYRYLFGGRRAGRTSRVRDLTEQG